MVSGAVWSLGEETGRGGVVVEIEGAGGGGWMLMLGARRGGGGGGKQARGGHTVTVHSDVTRTCHLGSATIEESQSSVREYSSHLGYFILFIFIYCMPFLFLLPSNYFYLGNSHNAMLPRRSKKQPHYTTKPN